MDISYFHLRMSDGKYHVFRLVEYREVVREEVEVFDDEIQADNYVDKQMKGIENGCNSPLPDFLK